MPENRPSQHSGNVIEVFFTFLLLGLTSFGGPVAHLSYFKIALVEKRRWVSEQQFAQLMAICQFLPGPASSQLGFSLGLARAGWPGAIAAFVAFTLPSAVLLVGFSQLLPYLANDISQAAIHGLKIVALAVVAHAVLGMSRSLCPDAARATIAIAAAAILLITDSAAMQLLVVIGGALAGVICCRSLQPNQSDSLPLDYSARTGWLLLSVFVGLLIALPLLSSGQQGWLNTADIFYRAGALVFGGGHVVLPLLEQSLVGNELISQDAFLAGYGAAQAVPGPMFSFAAYLGSLMPSGQGGGTGATIALLAIFLPGLLLIAAALPLWQLIANKPSATRAIAGVNAAVVGVLAAALYNPIFTSSINSPVDLAIGLIAFGLLTVYRLSPLIVVVWCITASIITVIV